MVDQEAILRELRKVGASEEELNCIDKDLDGIIECTLSLFEELRNVVEEKMMDSKKMGMPPPAILSIITSAIMTFVNDHRQMLDKIGFMEGFDDGIRRMLENSKEGFVMRTNRKKEKKDGNETDSEER